MKSFIANLIFSAMLYAIPEQPVAEGDFVMAAIVGGVLTAPVLVWYLQQDILPVEQICWGA